MERVRVDVDLPIAGQRVNRPARGEIDYAATVHRHRHCIGHGTSIRPVELTAGHNQIRARQRATDRQCRPVHQRVTSVSVVAGQRFGPAATLGQRPAAA